jgi:hypothetical protein
VRKDVDVSLLRELDSSELDGLFGERDLVATPFARVAELTETEIDLGYLEGFLVLEFDPERLDVGDHLDELRFFSSDDFGGRAVSVAEAE